MDYNKPNKFLESMLQESEDALNNSNIDLAATELVSSLFNPIKYRSTSLFTLLPQPNKYTLPMTSPLEWITEPTKYGFNFDERCYWGIPKHINLNTLPAEERFPGDVLGTWEDYNNSMTLFPNARQKHRASGMNVKAHEQIHSWQTPAYGGSPVDRARREAEADRAYT